MILQSLGGLGLFLLGMIVMTEGLRALAGDALRRSLIRFTRSPLSGAVTGAVSTTLLQSSSATTVATVGFVGAELMSFTAALGIIFGANIGSTITGWVVALVGFKLQLGLLAFPLVLGGAVVRLVAHGRAGAIGQAVAGFGLLFVGIATLQDGMAGLQDVLAFDRLPGDTIGGRLLLVAAGVAFTVVAQSSGAGVAATLTALNTGLVDLTQAGALVIGMDVGTTVTAALAAASGSPAARRTGLSHVVYNLLTAVGAFVLLGPYLLAWATLAPGAMASDPEIVLVAFHTGFNTLGVAAILPFTRPFARLMERLVPGTEAGFTRELDPALLDQVDLALRAVTTSLRAQLRALLAHVEAILGGPARGARARLGELQTALDETHAYVDRIRVGRVDDAHGARMLACLHALDHLQRLHERCEEEEDRAMTAAGDDSLAAERHQLVRACATVVDALDRQAWAGVAETAKAAESAIHARVPAYRAGVLREMARDALDVPEGTARLEAMRWLERVSTHVARGTAYLGQAAAADAPPPTA